MEMNWPISNHPAVWSMLMLTELYGNADGFHQPYQSWQCNAQASFALGHFHTGPLSVILTQPLLAQPEMPSTGVIPMRFSIP